MIAMVLGFLKTAIRARMKPIPQTMAPTILIRGIKQRRKPTNETTKPATPRPFLLVFSAIILCPDSCRAQLQVNKISVLDCKYRETDHTIDNIPNFF